MELWRPIVGYEDCYEVSDFGRVRSLPRLVGARGGMLRQLKGRMLKLQTQPNGYITVSLWIDGLDARPTVHRLVLQAFVGPCPPGLECCHEDGDSANNMRSNLRWDTKKANAQDCVAHGTRRQGDRINSTKLNVTQVREIKLALAAGLGTSAIGRTYGMSPNTIHAIKSGRTWKYA